MTQATAIEGKQGYLFLDNDTNGSIDQFTGRLELTEATIKGWRQYLRTMEAESAARGFTYAVSVSPAKEELFPDMYPHERAKRTAADVFVGELSDFTVVYHRAALRKGREFAYSKTDTHWTDYGAHVAALEVVRRWGLREAVNGLPAPAFEVIERIGDLGAKLTPMHSEIAPQFQKIGGPTAHLVYDNGISNNGCIRVYSNAQAPIGHSLMICGDSFGTNMALAFARMFRRVTYLYKPASIDWDVFNIERPRYVVLQINQRFVVGQPSVARSIFDIAHAKGPIGGEKRKLAPNDSSLQAYVEREVRSA